MPSLLPGFEYDIFISYRLKDNKGDRWVTGFVNTLKTELEATFKEDISIYFDENQHDGLLETHNIDKSLEGKLKCLIFIPIISQTYCDPKSFAWQHEFCAFNKQTSEDRFGRDIKLANGNVASRILPIKIHDLDAEDKALLENEIGGLLRALEFIARSAGINRPLTVKDDEVRTTGKILYRDQINKCANAIKEIIAGLKLLSPRIAGSSSIPPSRLNSTRPKEHHGKSTANYLAAILVLLLIGYVILTYAPFGSKIEGAPSLRSIAVLPFTNMSNDPEQEFFSDGITEQIITNLAQLKDLKVIARTSVMQYKKTSKSIAEIGKELDVTHVLEGSVRRAGDKIRITAQLITVKDESHLWAEDYNNTFLADIFRIQDDVSTRIAGSLKTKLVPGERDRLKTQRPVDPEAYDHYLKGEYFHSKYYNETFQEAEFQKSESEFIKAIRQDSTYALAHAGLANLYDSRSHISAFRQKYEALRNQYAVKAYSLSPQLPYCLLVKAYTFNSNEKYSNTDSAYKYMSKAYAMGPSYALACSEFAGFYLWIGLYEQTMTLINKGIQLNPASSGRYCLKAIAYIYLDSLDNAKKYLKIAQTLEPNSLLAQLAQAQIHQAENKPEMVEQDVRKIRLLNSTTIPQNFEAWLLAMKGEKEKALKLDSGAAIYIALGLRKEAIHRLEKDKANYLYLKTHFISKALATESGYQQLLERAKKEYDLKIEKYGTIDN